MSQEIFDYLPQGFEFYDQGLVEKLPGTAQLSQLPLQPIGLAYSVYGDWNGVLIIALEKMLDLSMYSELGNIIASRFVSALSRLPEHDAMISPPKFLDSEELSHWTSKSGALCVRYTHRIANRSIPFQAWIFKAPSQRELLDV